MGYVTLIADCGHCGRPFTSNPDFVPSLRRADGHQLVFCRACVEASAPERARCGLPPIHIHPLAYEVGEA